MQQARTYQLILWGATGFTGRLVARYLVGRYGVGGDLSWAIAGRNTEKLEALRTELASDHAEAASLPILKGDSDDETSLHVLAASASVVCSTVGPYARYGSALVAACVAEGTHYCDLTGETHWIREMIQLHGKAAEEQELRIVHCCGFDSIPSDLGCQVLQEAAVERHGAPASEVHLVVGRTSGGLSGGTLASMVGVMESAGKPEVRRALGDPYSLLPEGAPRGPDRGDQMGAAWDPLAGRWTGPFIMAGINTRVVRRSNALLGYAYGEDFSYSETTGCGRGLSGRLRALALAMGTAAAMSLLIFPPTRALLLATVLPAPGEGPSPEARAKGFFEIALHGRCGEERVRVNVRGEGDPGYAATSRMLAESAVSLALDQSVLPERFGVLTPAAAFGGVLRSRLASAGVTFEVLDS